LGLDDKTALNTPDTLTHEDIGKPKVSSSYQSNIIIQSSDDPVVIKAANVLFNKHPDTSILVKFDLFRQFLAQACRYKWLWRSLG
jgi:hypothetical protein